MAAVVQCAHGIEIPEELEKALHKYYRAEMEADWEAVYSLRSEKFRKHVRLGDFVSAMQTENKGWSLEKFSLVASLIRENDAELMVTFTEKPPTEFWRGSGLSGLSKVEMTEIAVWVNEHGTWKCKQAPSRGHLPYSE